MSALPSNLQHQICRVAGSRHEDHLDVLRRVARDMKCKEYVHQGKNLWASNSDKPVFLDTSDAVSRQHSTRTIPHRTCIGPDECFYRLVVVLVGSCPRTF